MASLSASAGATGTATSIRVSGLSKIFRRRRGGEVAAVDDVSLEVERGHIVVLLGPSGCGKTTLLRCVAGLETPTTGEIELNGQLVYSRRQKVNIPPEDRRVSMMFQSYAVWPHMTVFDNVAYPLRSRHLRGPEVRDRVLTTLDKTGIGALRDQYPTNLSGGQQQRVALARSLVVDPEIILFDEPLSNVDARVREQLRMEILRMQRDLRFTALYVTHDQSEAMQVADKLAVLREGRIEQLGSCRDVYASPASLYVADFVGGGNHLPAVVRSTDETTGRIVVESTLGPLEIRDPEMVTRLSVGEDVDVVVRPENIRLGAAPVDTVGWEGTVIAAMFVGRHVELAVDVGGEVLSVWQAGTATFAEGQAVAVRVPEEAFLVLKRAPVPA